MDIRNAVSRAGTFVDNEEMTGRQAAIIIFGFLGATVLMGLVAFFFVFILLGY